MICDFTLRDLELTPKQEKALQKRLVSLKRKLQHFTSDVVRLSIVVKKHEKNNFYSATFKMSLPKKLLVARSGGHSIEAVLGMGFEKLERHVDEYKGTYFIGGSTYPDRSSIRDIIVQL